jgi:uncharacterized metal-binding protein YceD (DUF177 family)
VTAPPNPPELQRLFPIARIGEGAHFVVDAKPQELAALAARMGVLGIDSLTCRFDLRQRDRDTIDATGVLRARVRQSCVVSLDPFEADIAEDFAIRFVPAGTESDDLDVESEDEIGYEGGVLDLGEAASEQLALALDPFPRKPGAELPPAASAEEMGAFAALAKLRRPG